MQKGKRKMFTAIVKFARLRIIITCFALALLGSVVGGGITEKTFLVFVLIAAWIVHANSVNDFADREIDLVNLKNAQDRPLITNDISLRQFWIIHGVSLVIMFIVASFFGSNALLLTFAVVIGDYLYSLKPFRITDKTFLSPLFLSIAYTYYSFSFGFWSGVSNKEYPALLVLGLFLAFAARILLKDFRDIKGDKKFGKYTFLLRFGARNTCLFSGALWFLAVIVVGKATTFTPGVLVSLLIGLFQIVSFLKILSQTKNVDLQQKFILFIAKTANSAILVLFVYFFLQTAIGLSDGVIQLLPAIVGAVLLSLNWFQYMRFKNQFAL